MRSMGSLGWRPNKGQKGASPHFWDDMFQHFSSHRLISRPLPETFWGFRPLTSSLYHVSQLWSCWWSMACTRDQQHLYQLYLDDTWWKTGSQLLSPKSGCIQFGRGESICESVMVSIDYEGWREIEIFICPTSEPGTPTHLSEGGRFFSGAVKSPASDEALLWAPPVRHCNVGWIAAQSLVAETCWCSGDHLIGWHDGSRPLLFCFLLTCFTCM